MGLFTTLHSAIKEQPENKKYIAAKVNYLGTLIVPLVS
jgi:hypothetical protein